MAVLSGFWCSFSKVKSGWSVKLTTHLHSVPRLRMSGGVPVFPVYVVGASQGKLYHIYGSLYESYNFGCVQVLTHEPVKHISFFLSVHRKFLSGSKNSPLVLQLEGSLVWSRSLVIPAAISVQSTISSSLWNILILSIFLFNGLREAPFSDVSLV
jgi:hypothetical protein